MNIQIYTLYSSKLYNYTDGIIYKSYTLGITYKSYTLGNLEQRRFTPSDI